jgi:hypothetical protein
MRAMSMKMPQKTPKAVSRLRVLLRVIVRIISLHVSTSIFIVYSALNASMGLIFVALRAGKKPANVPAMINVMVAWMATLKSTVGIREHCGGEDARVDLSGRPKSTFIEIFGSSDAQQHADVTEDAQ